MLAKNSFYLKRGIEKLLNFNLSIGFEDNKKRKKSI